MLVTIGEKKRGNFKRAKDLQKLFYAVLNASHDGILILDHRGIVIYINEAISRLLGYDSSKIVGKHFNTLIDNHIISKRSISLKALQEKRKITNLLEVRGQKMLTTATPYINNQKEVEFVISNIRNLGELDSLAAMFLQNQGEKNFPNVNCKYSPLSKKLIKEKIQGLGFPDFTFESDSMTQLCEIALEIAPLDIPVLIMGESGVGKGLISKIIHKGSFRAHRTMIEINCASFPESLIDSELFGYAEGTFTGAKKMGKTGLIEAANNSTLFLDEVGVMPLDFQTRFLKFLDDGHILPLGSTESKWVNVRVIAATNFDLADQVEKGRFRKDLFYRLAVLPLVIPPLRSRKEDINTLIEVLLKYYCKKYQKNIRLDENARRSLLYYSYPGNIRELKNIIERVTILAKNNDCVNVDGIPKHIVDEYISNNFSTDTNINVGSLKKMVESYESQLIKQFMDTYKSTYKVAEMLHTSQSTVVRKISRYRREVGINSEEK